MATNALREAPGLSGLMQRPMGRPTKEAWTHLGSLRIDSHSTTQDANAECLGVII